MSCGNVRVAYYMQNNAKLLETVHAILKCVTDSIRFRKKLLESVEPPENYARMSLIVLMARIKSTSPGEKARKGCSNRTHLDLVSNSTVLDRYRMERDGDSYDTRQ